MAHLLCTHCSKQFDDEKSFTVREFTAPAYLTKSHHEEILSFRRPICPHCGARDELLNMAALRANRPPATAAGRGNGY